jgi:hypothetical protein
MVARDTVAKQANALISLYEKNYIERYDHKPNTNRFREKWGYQDMIHDLGYDQARKVVDYYFNLPKVSHPVLFLHQNYDKINEALIEKEEDEIKRAELRRETEKRVKEFDSKNG